MAGTSLSAKGAAYGLLALVGIIVLYIFGFSRGIDMVTQASQERANNQAKIEALQKKISDLRTLQQQFAQAQDQVNALSVAMPADKQMAEVVAMMETIAARAGIILENVQPSQAVADGLPVAVSVRGGYGGVLTFAELMEKNVRPIKIGPVNIVAGEGALSATFNTIVLYQVPPEDLPQETAPVEGEVTQ